MSWLDRWMERAGVENRQENIPADTSLPENQNNGITDFSGNALQDKIKSFLGQWDGTFIPDEGGANFYESNLASDDAKARRELYDATKKRTTDVLGSGFVHGLLSLPGTVADVTYDLSRPGGVFSQGIDDIPYETPNGYIPENEWLANKNNTVMGNISGMSKEWAKPYERQYEDRGSNLLYSLADSLPESLAMQAVGWGVGGLVGKAAQTVTKGAKLADFAADGTKAANLISKAGNLYNGSSKAAQAARFLTPSAETVGATLAQSSVEGALERYHAIDDYVEEAKRNGNYVKGVTEQQAIDVGNKVYGGNMMVLPFTNALEYATTFGKRGLSILNNNPALKSKIPVYNLIVSSLMEGNEEAAQEIINRMANNKDWSLDDQEIVDSFLTGAMMGGGQHIAFKALADSNIVGSSDPLTSEELQNRLQAVNESIRRGAVEADNNGLPVSAAADTPEAPENNQPTIPMGTEAVMAGAEPFLGVRMDNGANGCVEAVTKIGAEMGSPFLSEQLRNGVVYVPTLVQNAGDRVIPFDANQLEAGDIIVYGDDDHVVMYDGNGGYVGNSSSRQQVVHDSDYTDMSGLEPTKIIKNDGNSGASAPSHNMSAFDAMSRLANSTDIMNDFISEAVINGQMDREALAHLLDDKGNFKNTEKNRKEILDNNEELFREYLTDLVNSSNTEIAKRVASNLSKGGNLEALNNVQQAIQNNDGEAIEMIANSTKMRANQLLDSMRTKTAKTNSATPLAFDNIINNPSSKDSAVKNFYRDFVADRIGSVDDPEEINRLSAMLNTKGKLHNTPENRKALAETYRQEMEDYYNNVYAPRLSKNTERPVQQAQPEPVQQETTQQAPAVNNDKVVQQEQPPQQEQINYQSIGNRLLDIMQQRGVPVNAENVRRALNSGNAGMVKGAAEYMYRELAGSGMNVDELDREVASSNRPLLEEGGNTNAIENSNRQTETAETSEGTNAENQVQNTESEQTEKKGEVEEDNEAIVKKWADKARKAFEKKYAAFEKGIATAEECQKQIDKELNKIIKVIPEEYKGLPIEKENRDAVLAVADEYDDKIEAELKQRQQESEEAPSSELQGETPSDENKPALNRKSESQKSEREQSAQNEGETDTNVGGKTEEEVKENLTTEKATDEGGEALSVEENIQRGKDAIQKVRENHNDVPNAMYRKETGWIEFKYGEEGTEAKDYEDGYGISKILKKHGQKAVDMVPEVLAKGTASKEHKDRIYFDYDGYKAVVRLTWNKDRHVWLVTNFEIEEGNKKESHNAGVVGRPAPTTTRPSSSGVDSISNSNISQDQENVTKNSEKKSEPKVNRDDITVEEKDNQFEVQFNFDQYPTSTLMRIKRKAKSEGITEVYGKGPILRFRFDNMDDAQAFIDKISTTDKNLVVDRWQPNPKQKETTQEQAKVEEAKNSYNGFIDTLPASQQARAQKTLSVKVDDVDGKQVTRAEYVEKAVADDRPIHKVENGKKTEYRIYTGDDTNSYAKVTKTEYDYAMYLGAKPLDVEAPAETETKSEEKEEKAEPKDEAKETTKKKSKKSSDKLEDFGEHLEGAKKDYYASYKDKMEQAAKENLGDIPLSKWWPEPNYQKLLDNGVSKDVVNFIRALRDIVSEIMPDKRNWKYDGWKTTAEFARKISNNALNDGNFDTTFLNISPELKGMIKFKELLYDALGHEKSLKGYNVDVITSGTIFYYPTRDSESIPYEATSQKPVYRFRSGKKGLEYLKINKELRAPSYSIDEIAEKAIQAIKEGREENATDDKKSKKPMAKISVGRLSGSSTYMIFVKWGSGNRWSALAEGFETPQEARNYLEENREELYKKYEELRKTPKFRGETNSARIGKDYRNGKDVTPEQFSEAFGFRGVQFGNWVKNAKRQQDLNEAFDALMDLADVLGISPRALSLGGELGLAFGARGSGNANAHYEPTTFVINLTNTRGAGSLAHEWFHALDNYLTQTHRSLKPSYMTHAYHSEARKELEEAVKELRKAFSETGYLSRSSMIDALRSNDYWSTNHEMGARAFEAYVIYKLKQAGYQNDYLANVRPQSEYDESDKGKKDLSRYPYPTNEEMENTFAEAFDNLFTAIEEKSEGGNVVLYSLSDSSVEAMSPEDFEQAVKDEFSYAKDFTKKDNVISFVLPNGKKIHVDLVNRIAFTDEDKAKAEQAYGREVKDNEAPEGAYTNAGEEGFISVAMTGNKGAISHEAYHVSREFLSDKAKNFLSSKFKNEEAEAEVYRKWRDGRNRDGMFGKIWQQIKDVASSFANLLGIQTEHEIFRQIESGKVYENTAVNGKSQNTKYSLATEKQLEKVRKQYEGTDQWMKAPNGKPTNLTERQWLQVRTPNFKEWFGDWENDPKNASKIVDENGEPLVVYHGTPLGGFEEFNRELNYFTADKEYADRYQDPGASSDYVKGVHEELGEAMTYPVFLNIRKPFDTRNAKERKIFENEFYRQWGNGAPLSDKGLPDWTDSDDFREFFEENDYDYDGLLLDEGGVPDENGGVKSRGISYVAFEPNQIKSATENNGDFSKENNNIKLSISEGEATDQRSTEEIKDDVLSALPNPLKVEDHGDTMTIYMPNDVTVDVEVVDNVSVTDEELEQARKEHGIGKDVNITVNGKFKVTGAKRAMISLARNGKKGTAYHEIVHLAYELALTKEQKQGLNIVYGAQAKAAGKDIQEYLADKMRDDLEAKKKLPKGLQKVYEAITDMIDKLQRAILGNNNGRSIMRDIETGRAFENKGTSGKVGKNYSSISENSVDKNEKPDDNEEKIRVITKDIKGFRSAFGKSHLRLWGNLGVPISEQEQIFNDTKPSVALLKDDLANAKSQEEIDDIRERCLSVLEEVDNFNASKTELAKDENAVRVFIAREAFEHHENTINARRRVAREAAQGVQKGNKSTGSNILGGEIGNGVLARESQGSSPKTPDITINAVMQVTGERDESKKHYLKLYEEQVASDKKRFPNEFNDENQSEKAGFSNAKTSLSISPADGNSNESILQKLKNRFKGQTTESKDYRRMINHMLEEVAKVKIRGGKLSPGEKVIFKELEGVLRVKNLYDWQTMLPSVGKAVAKQLGLSESNEMNNYIADWLFTGATNKTETQEAKDFAKALKEYPVLADKLINIQQAFNSWQQRTAWDRADNIISYTPERSSAKESFTSALDKIYDQFIEELGPVKRMIEDIEAKKGGKIPKAINPYWLFRRFRGHHGEAMVMVEGETNKAVEALQNVLPNVDFTGFKTIHQILSGLGALKDAKKRERFSAYCMAMHVYDIYMYNQKVKAELHDLQQQLDKNKELIKKLKAEKAEAEEKGDKKKAEELERDLTLATNERQKMVAKDNKLNDSIMETPMSKEDCMKIISDGKKEFDKAQQELVKYSDTLTAMLVDSGVISQKTANNWKEKFPNHVPMFREFEENEEINYGDSLKKAHGSDRKVIDPLQSIIRNTYDFVKRAEKNKCKLALAQIARCTDMGEYIEEVNASGRPNLGDTITFYEGGHKKRLVTDPAVVKAVNNMGVDNSNMLIQLLRMPAAIARACFTLINPTFAIRNVMRDVSDATIYSKYGFKPWDFISGFLHALRKDEVFYEWLASGAAQASMISLDRNYTQSTIDKMTKSLASRTLSPRGFFDLLQKAGEYSEYGTRIAAYERARNALRDAGKPSAGLIDAALESRDLMDFARGGKGSRAWNSIAIFSNATIQGWDKFFRTFDFKNDPKGAMKALARLAVTSFLPALVFALAYRDDDWYQELPDWLKDTHWIVGKVGDEVIRIPKGQDPAIRLFSSMIDRAISRTDKNTIDRQWDTFKEMLPSLMPTAILPIVEAMANYSFFSGKSIVPKYLEKLPDEAQYTVHTSSLAKAIGQATGLSPAKVDHVIGGYTGNVGKGALQLLDWMARDNKSINTELSDMPIVSGVTYMPYKNPKSVTKYYKDFDEQTKLHNLYKLTKEKPDGYDPEYYKKLKAVQKKMQELAKKERNLVNNADLTQDERYAKQIPIQEKRLELVKKVIRY